jgi:cytochrome c oxidase subunit 3
VSGAASTKQERRHHADEEVLDRMSAEQRVLVVGQPGEQRGGEDRCARQHGGRPARRPGATRAAEPADAGEVRDQAGGEEGDDRGVELPCAEDGAPLPARVASTAVGEHSGHQRGCHGGDPRELHQVLEPGPVTAVGSVARPPATRVGMMVWLASELMFFAGLFAAYFGLAAANDVWPPADVDLDVLRAAIFTLVLVASSGSMHLATQSAERGEIQRAQIWLGVTIVAGGLFLTNQILEYQALHFGIDTHSFGSVFYLMTGFHWLHVFGGLVLLAVVLVRLGTHWGHEALPLGGYYWHFVDIVWVALFSVLYLLS